MTIYYIEFIVYQIYSNIFNDKSNYNKIYDNFYFLIKCMVKYNSKS
jgi:hypothetical protein